MTIDTAALDALGDNWLMRVDKDGVSHGGFVSAPVGEWTVCPRWSDATGASCGDGGLFGQGPGGYGATVSGNRIVFAETRGPRIVVEGNKVKVREFRALYLGAEAWEAVQYKCGGTFPGSLYLSDVTLPEGFTIGDVGGSLNLDGAKMPEGFTIGNVGGSLYLRGATLPEGFTIGNVGGWLNLSGAKMQGCANASEIRAKIKRTSGTRVKGDTL